MGQSPYFNFDQDDEHYRRSLVETNGTAAASSIL